MTNEEPEVLVPTPTSASSVSIKAIGKDTVHKICSGQVVLSLAVAVKELVENSVDAGATIVQVKLKDQGLESIEVSDNGNGVEAKNFTGLTAKYHTSKLREFSDLSVVETFGFRGEALSSLCALSDMVITTKHTSAAIGTRLELDKHGEIIKQTPFAMENGTTVTLTKLFECLPVRKREFKKNIKKEFLRMCQILQAYCLVSKGVRIICTNQTAKGSKTTLMSTHGSHNISENIVSIFGAKQAADLIELKPPIGEFEKYSMDVFANILEENSNSNIQMKSEDFDKLNLSKLKIEGWISSCSHGCGRSSKDRQYFFINSRPCEPKNISKLVNEMYHRYNIQQYPFVYLNLIIERSEVDVNLTPDKRQLLINNEKILLLVIKKSLINTFGNIPSTFKLQNTNAASSNDKLNDDEDLEEFLTPNMQGFMEKLSQWKKTGDTVGPCKPLTKRKQTADDDITVRNNKMRKIQEYLSQPTETTTKINHTYCSDDSDADETAATCINEMSFDANKMEKDSKDFDLLLGRINSDQLEDKLFNAETLAEPSVVGNISENDEDITMDHVISCRANPNPKSINFYSAAQSAENYTQHQDDVTDITIELDEEIDENEMDSIHLTPDFDDEIQISIEEIQKMVLDEEKFQADIQERAKLDRLKFKTEINPSKNHSAEEELKREITKDMFQKMEILGQFNLGFIIVRLDQDLFIIDQHASDEKYNFEDLQKTVVVQHQKLVIPENLELSAVDEMVLLDNIQIFETNGFKFQIDENAPTTKKIKLLGKPFSKNWEFGKNDIADLIFMLQDAPEGTMCRPPRIRDMFASRACRKSVMIGKALSKNVMRKLVDHMGEIEHPWNCPHGRPTMRHLVNLTMLDDDDDDL